MDPDTIFALSSGRPPAAIALIRVSGPFSHEAGRALAGTLPAAREAAVRELVDPRSGERLDEALVLRFDGPASATGENVVELHCHGSRAVVDAVLSALAAFTRLREARPGEFTRRAFENGRIDLTEAEGLADLLEAETEMQRRAALRMAEGGLRREIARWQDRTLALSAEAERAIDYAEEDEDGGERGLGAAARELAEELSLWLERPSAEPLRHGLKVVFAGPPNSGKSSLINAIVGTDRIIVSAVAGTTRDVIEIPLALDGVPLLVTDTAGLRESGDAVEAIGIARAGAEIRAADIALWLGEPEAAPAHSRLIRVHSRADLKGPAPDGSWPASATTGAGITELLAEIGRVAREMLPPADAIALNQRQAAALAETRDALVEAADAPDPVIAAESLRSARAALDRLTGRAGVEDVLDALFARFCLGK